MPTMDQSARSKVQQHPNSLEQRLFLSCQLCDVHSDTQALFSSQKKYIGINQCDLSIITITLLHKKELATMKPSTSMMSSPTSVATAARGTMDAVMANTSFSKVCLLTPKLKTQCCYDYKADECIRHRQYKIEQRSQIQAPQLDIRI